MNPSEPFSYSHPVDASSSSCSPTLPFSTQNPDILNLSSGRYLNRHLASSSSTPHGYCSTKRSNHSGAFVVYPIEQMKFSSEQRGPNGEKYHCTTTPIGLLGEETIEFVHVHLHLPAVIHASAFENENSSSSHSSSSSSQNSESSDSEETTAKSYRPVKTVREYVRRVDAFARVAIRSASLEFRNGKQTEVHSVLFEIEDNVNKHDRDNWERLGRYGYENDWKHEMETKNSINLIADIRFPFCRNPQSHDGPINTWKPQDGGGSLPVFAFKPGDLSIKIEWASMLEDLYEFSGTVHVSKDNVVSHPLRNVHGEVLHPSDVQAFIHIGTERVSDADKKELRKNLRMNPFEYRWNQYFCHSKRVDDLKKKIKKQKPIVVPLRQSINASCKHVLFYLKTEWAEKVKRHFDFSGGRKMMPDGKGFLMIEPFAKYEIVRSLEAECASGTKSSGPVNLAPIVPMTTAITGRTIRFEEEFEGKCPEDMFVYMESFERLNSCGFLDVSWDSNVALKVHLNPDVASANRDSAATVYAWIAVLNTVTLTPDPLNPNYFVMTSSIYSNLQTESNAGLEAAEKLLR